MNNLRLNVELVTALAWKNVKIKYKNSWLGFFWSLINPLIFLMIFNYIFGHAFPEIENYRLYALSGLLVWSLFPVASNQVIQSMVDSSSLLKSLKLPVSAFPIAALLSALVNFLLTLIPFTALMFYLGYQFSAHIFLIFPVIALYAVMIFGFSLILCSVHVYFRDVGLLWNTFLPALFYLTPIAYPVELIPNHLRWVMHFNPLYHFVYYFREIICYNRSPGFDTVWPVVLTTGFLAVAGWIVFKKLQRGFISHY
jgi:ABC-2 type transport system permease protein